MTEKSGKKVMPKGVRKGGTRYPRHKLAEALEWSKKLVAKTHLGPQPAAIILSGVVGATSGVGQVRISSLRQFGLLEGEAGGISATALARDIAAAPPEDVRSLVRKAALTPSVFKALFDTFHGDSVSRARLAQRAAALKVHPEETENCIENYVASLQLAELVFAEGDSLAHISAADAANGASVEGGIVSPLGENGDPPRVEEEPAELEDRPRQTRAGGAAVTINIAVDSSLDTDKLEKQLALLKKYGAL